MSLLIEGGGWVGEWVGFFSLWGSGLFSKINFVGGGGGEYKEYI